MNEQPINGESRKPFRHDARADFTNGGGCQHISYTEKFLTDNCVVLTGPEIGEVFIPFVNLNAIHFAPTKGMTDEKPASTIIT